MIGALSKTALFVLCHSTLPASYWIVVNLIRLSKSTRFPELHRSDPYRARLKNWYYPSFFWRHHYFSQSFQISPLGEIERGRISVSLLWLILDIMILNKSQNHQKWRKCKTFDLSPNSLDAKWDFIPRKCDLLQIWPFSWKLSPLVQSKHSKKEIQIVLCTFKTLELYWSKITFKGEIFLQKCSILKQKSQIFIARPPKNLHQSSQLYTQEHTCHFDLLSSVINILNCFFLRSKFHNEYKSTKI